MIGRDFSHVGADNGIYCKYGDGYGYPYRGPVKTVFLDGNTVAVMDADKGIYVQRLGGTAYYICPPTHALETMKSPTASDSEEEDDKRKVETEAFETNYVDVDPTDMCTIPMTENVAISDRSNVIKIINKYEWFIDSTVGSLGSGLGMLSRASSIDSFQIGAQIFFVVAECGNQRIQILSEGCKHIMSAGGAGPLAGQFRDPVSIAAFSVPYPFKPATATAKKKRGAMDALNASRLAAPNQSKGPVNRYAPVSLADKPDWYHGVCQFRDLRMRVARKMKVGSYALGKRVDDHSMYDFVFVSQPYEFNPPTIEHVAFRIEDGVVVNTTEDEKGMDTGGYDCLWTAICKYNKFLRHGRDKRAFVNIAVADVGNHRVQIFKYYYSTYPDLYLPELEVDSVVGGAREQVVHLEEPVAVAYTTTGELIICDVGIKKVVILSPAMHVIVNRHFSFDFSPNMHLISSRPGTRSNNESGLAEVGRRRVEVPTYDHKACTVSVARDGKIAIGFKCGGMIVYKPYIAYAMGALEIFTEDLFKHVLSYLPYSDIESLRNCCRYLHDFTRDLRKEWALTGLRPQARNCMIYNFIKWSKTIDNVPLLNSTILINDQYGTEICTKHLECNCHDKYCLKSHQDPVFDIQALLGDKTSYLDIDGCLTCVSFTFSPCFLWRAETYVRALFEFYAQSRLCIRRKDPMTRRNEVLRDVFKERVNLIAFQEYATMMTVLEEDFRELKPVTAHPLFNGNIMARKRKEALSKIRSQHREHISDVTVRYHKIEAMKYNEKISIPPTKSKAKQFRLMDNMSENQMCGVQQDAIEHHIHTFEHTSNRMDDMLSSLFS